MSVLLKGMTMPETCDDCPFHVYHSHYEYVCKATPMFYPMNLANSNGIRKDWCPLVEVKPPHGRLIDESVVLELIREDMGIKSLDFLYNAEKSVVNQVVHAPTVIEAEGE